MEFGPTRTENAAGLTLAHSIRAGGRRWPKGAALTPADIAALLSAGVTELWAAHFTQDDMQEDAAAALVAAPLAKPGLTISAPFTGRVNIYAERAGVLRVNASAINAANAVDEAVTIASLADYARVAPRQMLATVKIIPYAAPKTAARAAAAQLSGALTLHPFRLTRASLILTRTAGVKPALITKGAEAIAARLAAVNVAPEEPVITAHETAPLAKAIAAATGEIILILGGSATSDRRDVCPAAVVAAGGRITRFGMPVDPGNLLFTADLGGRPVLGLPGCARSPKLNGADWVLERMIAGIPVESAEIEAMGVGGLLKEIPSRPQPRAGGAPDGRAFVSCLLLAAGSSTRMQGRDKLLGEIHGEALIRRAAKAFIDSQADEVIVVLRPGDDARRAALAGLAVRIIENPLAAEGMGSSIRAGMAAIAPGAEAALIALADMPEISSADVNKLIAAYDAGEGRDLIRAATPEGAPGNPTLLGRRFFESLRALNGDQGARVLFKTHEEHIRLVPLTTAAARIDLDTEADWANWLNRV